MPDLVENYLRRLQTRLEKRMPLRLAEDHVREIQLHLAESVASRVERGNSTEKATVEALQALGSDALLAEGLIRQHLGLNILSPWRFAWLPCLALLTYGLVPWEISEVQVPTWIETFASWNILILVLSFGYACWRSRRLIMKPIALALGLMFILDMIHFAAFSSAGFTGHSSELRKQIIAGFDRNIRDVKSEIKSAEKMRSDAWNGFEPKVMTPTMMAPAWSVGVNERGVAGVPISIADAPTLVLSLKPVSDRREAMALWSKNGTGYLRRLHGDLNEAVLNQKFWLNFTPDPRRLLFAAWSFLQYGATFGVILAAFNMLVLGAQRACGAVRSRLWKPAQPA